MQTGAGTTCLALRVVRPHGEQRKEVGLCKEETSMATHRLRITGYTKRSSTWGPLGGMTMQRKSLVRPKGGMTPGTLGGQKTRSRLS